MPKQTSLLETLAQRNRELPLAEALRPTTLAEFYGQAHVIGPGSPLRAMMDARTLTSLIFWGPPGVGKTTLARMMAAQTEALFIPLSAVNAGVKELREAVQQAEEALQVGQKTVVFIDEIHRFSKTQQDALLPHVENGTFVLIGATTENPSFQVIPALLSRLLVVRLDYLSRDDLATLLRRAVESLGNVFLGKEAGGFILDYANGDARSALTLLDIASRSAPLSQAGDAAGQRLVTIELLEKLAQHGRLNYDRQGDEHYDHASAYQKSMRGSDVDASLYWLGKMIAAGEDPRFIARRLIVTASEDVGLADPMALVIAMAASEAVEKIGLPEGRIPLAEATIYVAQAPKSNTAISAIDAVLRDIQTQGKSYPVPKHLRDSHYQDAQKYGHGVGYKYSHEHPDTPQTFLPEELLGTSYWTETLSEQKSKNSGVVPAPVFTRVNSSGEPGTLTRSEDRSGSLQ